jgi:hypothetical protein
MDQRVRDQITAITLLQHAESHLCQSRTYGVRECKAELDLIDEVKQLSAFPHVVLSNAASHLSMHADRWGGRKGGDRMELIDIWSNPHRWIWETESDKEAYFLLYKIRELIPGSAPQ